MWVPTLSLIHISTITMLSFTCGRRPIQYAVRAADVYKRQDLALDADEDGNISQETADEASSIDVESFDSLPLLANFHNITTFGIGDYDSESYDISSISTITHLSIGDCSVPQVDLTRFPQLPVSYTHLPIGETIVWMNYADVKLGKYVWKLR